MALNLNNAIKQKKTKKNLGNSLKTKLPKLHLRIKYHTVDDNVYIYIYGLVLNNPQGLTRHKRPPNKNSKK